MKTIYTLLLITITNCAIASNVNTDLAKYRTEYTKLTKKWNMEKDAVKREFLEKKIEELKKRNSKLFEKT